MSVLAVAGRELRGLFVTPFGWIALAVMQFVAAWLFLVQLEGFVQLQARLAAVAGAPGVTDLVVAPALAQVGVLLLLVMPLVSMRAISGERQAGTLQLLLAAPLSAGEIVLGKFLGALGFGLLALGLLGLMPLALLVGTALDLGKLLAGMLGWSVRSPRSGCCCRPWSLSPPRPRPAPSACCCCCGSLTAAPRRTARWPGSPSVTTCSRSCAASWIPPTSPTTCC
jgi:ABC-type transport system involved in multi-copper enzyme maturation permease subunit